MPKSKIGYLRVLIVDDSRMQRNLMREMLTKFGFIHVDEAENSTQAYEKMDALRYDIVFLDWVMPGRSGVSLMEEWREDRRYDDVAMFVVSMQDDKAMIAGAIKAGALSYIIKPITEGVLLQNVDKALKWIEERRAAREAE
ncbi:MAG: response regulator receiver protein [Alphaproteobacteria bacterium]|jgi:PleD family two-component response regulator|nr:response regulator receiver protein [Alphaproteobacteria bacterium]